nr:uncharacterized protein LOC109154734 [Ipomoea batatas]
MFQTKADDARREAERIQRIALSEYEKSEEEYACRYLKLRLSEAEAERQYLFEKMKLQDNPRSTKSNNSIEDPTQTIEMIIEDDVLIKTIMSHFIQKLPPNRPQENRVGGWILLTESTRVARNVGTPARATPCRCHPGATSLQGHPETTSRRGHLPPKPPRALPEATSHQRHPEATSHQGHPEATSHQSYPEVPLRLPPSEATSHQGHPEVSPKLPPSEATSHQGHPETISLTEVPPRPPLAETTPAVSRQGHPMLRPPRTGEHPYPRSPKVGRSLMHTDLHSSMDVSCFANELSTFICINNGYLKGKKRLVRNKEQRNRLPRQRGMSSFSPLICINNEYLKSVNQDSQMDIWDRECMELIGIGAVELYDKHDQITTKGDAEPSLRVCLETQKMISINHFRVSRVCSHAGELEPVRTPANWNQFGGLVLETSPPVNWKPTSSVGFQFEQTSSGFRTNAETRSGNWDIDLLHDIFDDQDVERILRTPVSSLFSDCWYWKGDLRGQYSVHLGYQAQTNDLLVQESNLSFTAWKHLWKMRVPPKIKNFIWRCVRNILPVREVLCARATNLWNGFDDHVGGSFVEIVENYLKRNDAHKTLEMAARLWATWSARNEALWNNKIWSANYLKGFVESCVSSWQQNYFPNTRPLHEVHNAAPVMWSPPPMGMLKCNVDASLHQNGLGFGAVIRDHAGQFVAANIGRLRCTFTVQQNQVDTPGGPTRSLVHQICHTPSNDSLKGPKTHYGVRVLTHLEEQFASCDPGSSGVHGGRAWARHPHGSRARALCAMVDELKLLVLLAAELGLLTPVMAKLRLLVLMVVGLGLFVLR